MAYRMKTLVIPLAGALILTAAVAASAQSANGVANSAQRQGGTAATLKGENRSQNATGNRAVPRLPAEAATTAAAAVSAAPVALALESSGPAPASSPEPLSVILIGGALAGLYKARKHLV